MDCDPKTAFSGEKSNFGPRKKVSWAFNLEEVKYFFPDFDFQQFQEPEGKVASTDSMQAKLKKKLNALKIRRRAPFSDVGDREFLRWVQEKGVQVMDKIPGRFSVVKFKDLTVSEENSLLD